MNNELNLSYYYGAEAEQFAFFRIPKLLFTDSRFSHISTEAKLLYGMMLDRMSLSIRNGWIDEYNRVYIYFKLEDAIEYMGIGKDKGVKLFSELDDQKGIGLISRKKQGMGKPTMIYVMNFASVSNNSGNISKDNIENDDTTCSEAEVKTSEIPNSRLLKNRSQDFGKSDSNNTDISNTEFSNTYPIQSYQERKISLNANGDEKESKRLVYKQLIYSNISYDILIRQNRQDRIDEIVQIMLDAVCSDKESLIVGGEALPQRMVQDRLLKLNSDHIEYVIECMDNCTSQIKNIRQYLLTALYNSLSTIDHYYLTKVNHDLTED